MIEQILPQRIWDHTWIRILLHTLDAGITMGLYLINPIWGVMFFIAFLYYEILEDWRIVDHSYKDVLGWLIGWVIVCGMVKLLGWS